MKLNKKSEINFGFIAFCFVLLMIFVMGLLKLYSPDLGFHLKSAAWMLEHKKFIYTDTFSESAEGQKYFDLQWLYQLFIYALYKNGASTLVVTNALLITCSFVLVWWRFKTNTDSKNSQLGLFAFLLLLFVQPLSFEVRPHVLSWIYLNLLLMALAAYKRGYQKSIFALPFIMLLWVNSHSLSILGLIVIGIYNLGIFLERKKVNQRLLIFSFISLAAFIINPYFLEGLLFPFKQFGIISGNNLFKEYIGELQSPFSAQEIKKLGIKYFTSPLLFLHLSALLSLFSIFQSLYQKRFTDTLLLIAFAFLLQLGVKNYGYYLMVSLPLMVQYAHYWLASRKGKGNKQKATAVEKAKVNNELPISVAGLQQKLLKRFAIATIVSAIIITITSVTDGFQLWRSSPYRFGITESTEALPVDATNFLIKNNIQGKLLNHLDFGGYLMFHYKEKVFIDGRIEPMKEGFFEKYYNSLKSPKGMEILINEFQPDLVIFPYLKATGWWSFFLSTKNQSGYKLVYFDGLSVIYLKASVFPQIAALEEKNTLTSVDITALQRINACLETSKPSRFVGLIKGLYQKQYFSVADQNKATFCFTYGFNTAALCYSVIGIERSTLNTPNIYKNLGIFFQDNNRYSEASLCEEKSTGAD